MLNTLLTLLSTTSPSSPPPATTLKLSQYAPLFLSSPLSTSDTPETWLLYEHLLLSCLRTQDDQSARLCLTRLSDRFGATNERVMALSGLYDEATAESTIHLEAILKRYEEILSSDPTNIPITKRMISLKNTLGKTQASISSLTTLLSYNPTDAESWMELSSAYFKAGLYSQAVFCLEEVLLIHPNAYNVFARLGEITYIQTSQQQTSGSTKEEAMVAGLSTATRYYLRAIELCDDYLRGYYGLKLVTDKLLTYNLPSNTSTTSSTSTQQPLTHPKISKLNQLATTKLLHIVSAVRRKDNGYEGYDIGEVEAAAEFLEEAEKKTVR